MKLDGVIVTCKGRGFFSVQTEEMDNPVLCRLAGKMSQNKIKVVEGDQVEIEVDAANLERGRITYRRRQ